MKAYTFSIECNDGHGEDPHQKYSYTVQANSEAEANAIINEEYKHRKMYEKSIDKTYDLDLFIDKIIEEIKSSADITMSYLGAVPTPIANMVSNILKQRGYGVTTRWTGANTNIRVEFFPRKVLRTRTFCPAAFEGNLEKAIEEALPDSIEYMYLNGVVWYVKSPEHCGQKRTAIDTGLRYKDIIQDVVPNEPLEHIKTLME